MTRRKVALAHVPRTGGTALGSHLYYQTRESAPTYFFSFFGLDSSHGANRLVVERLRRGDEDHRRLLANAHFQAASVLMGHFSYDLAELLDGYDLRFAAVLREPVARSISLIYQYTGDGDAGGRFGAFSVPSKTRSPEAYWEAMLGILREHGGGPVPGLAPHESMMLFGAMSHTIAGTPLHTFSPSVDFARMQANLPRFALAQFERFNESVGALLRELDVPVVLDEATNYVGAENPVERLGHRPHYGAPPELVELVRTLCEDDQRLYELVADRGLYVG